MLKICCGPVNRGVALYHGKVYAGLLDGRVVALDQETGKVVWSVKDTPNDDTILTAAIRVVKGKVIVGSSGAEQAVRGYFSAYDAETGKRVWRLYTVPGPSNSPSSRWRRKHGLGMLEDGRRHGLGRDGL